MKTPTEFKQNQLYAVKKKYYEIEEVDELLSDLYKEYENVYTMNAELTKQVKKLSDGVQYYRSIETTLQQALVLAEKTAKETKDAAVLKAETIENDANEKARTIIQNAENEGDLIKSRCNQLATQFAQYKEQLIVASTKHLELIQGVDFAVSAPVTPQLVAPTVEAVPAQEPIKEDITIKKQPEDTQDIVSEISSNFDTTSNIKKVIEKVESTLETAEKNTEGVQPPRIRYKEEPQEEVKEEVAVTVEEAVIEEVPAEAKEEPTIEVKQVEEQPSLDTTVPKQEPVGMQEAVPVQSPIKEKTEQESQTLDSLLNDLNMNSKKKDDEDPFEFLGSLDDF